MDLELRGINSHGDGHHHAGVLRVIIPGSNQFLELFRFGGREFG